MRRAAAIITDHGGSTSHAAIVSRELGLPAIVGTGNATEVLHAEQEVTVSCAEGDQGFVYEGTADIETEMVDIEQAAENAHADHAQSGKSSRCSALVASSCRRRRAGAHGVRGEQPHPRASDGVGEL